MPDLGSLSLAGETEQEAAVRCYTKWLFGAIYQAKEELMARRCEICGKGPAFGRNVSHAHNVTPRRFQANIQSVRAVVKGSVKRIKVCTRCIRSNKVVKAA